MKTHSPLLILFLWLIALTLSSAILYSCGKPDVNPMRGDCMNQQQDTATSTPDSAAQY